MEHTKNHKLTMLVAAILILMVGVGLGYLINRTSSTDDAASPSASLSTVSSQASATEHNDADIMFAQMMTPHHSQAIEMAQLASSRAGSEEVKSLAKKIEAAQQPEIDKMNGWLADWNAPEMAMDHSGHGGMSGMMTSDMMSDLASKSGADFDKAFLTMMIEHHTGAIDMAKDQLANGKYAEALAMAAGIQVTQQAEINEMKALLQ